MRRVSPVYRALAAAGAGAVSAVVFVIALYNLHPAYTLNLGGEVPAIASGLYDVERSGDHLQVWTGRRALLALHDANRDVPWTCRASLRGGRPANLPAAVVTMEVDGVAQGQHTLTDVFEDIVVTAAPRNRSGLQVAIVSATFTPGGADQRELGVQLEALSCRPTGFILPPRRAMANAAGAAAIFGVAFGLTAMATVPAIVSAVIVAAAQAYPITTGPGPYTIAFQKDIMWLATWVALSLLVTARSLEWFVGIIRGAALFALACSAVVLYAKLLAIVHPSKPLVDAVFHAHRLDDVMGGRYFFTQPIRNGVLFPYSIGLYVFAWPWAAITRDHVTLLRVVVLATEALAGCLLYRMVVKGWRDRFAGALAVALFATVPLPYVVVGNANLTNAFGQSVALIAIAAASTWSFDRKATGIAALTVLIALGLLSHVSTLMLLLTTLGLLAVLYVVLGGQPLRPAAIAIAIATTLALVAAVGLYYGHFGDAYRTLWAVRSGTSVATTAASAATISIPVRAGQAVTLIVQSIGWPLVLLAIVGLWRLPIVGVRNRVGLAVIALGATGIIFIGFTVLSPVDPAYVRYADEFITRAVYAAYPAVVLLSALAAAWAIRAGGIPRVLGLAMLTGAAVDGIRQWVNWL